MVPVRAFREDGEGGVRVKKEINMMLFFVKLPARQFFRIGGINIFLFFLKNVS
jgi:hypothetical protein